MNGIGMDLNIHFTPLLPEIWLTGITAACVLLLVLSLLQRRKGWAWRTLLTAAFITFLFGPSLIHEEREPVKDVAVIVVDSSFSQMMGRRDQTAQKALSYLKQELAKFQDLDMRVVEAPKQGTLANKTELFEALDRTLADVPRQRRAGVVFLTDGQVHDIPQNTESFGQYGPVHTLLTGRKNEKDRQMKIIQAAAYGIVGQNVTVRYKVDDTTNTRETTAVVTLNAHDGKPETFAVPVGEEQTIELPITHAGQNVFELTTDALEGELTHVNNRAALIVNGVRDRLRVLLVSGQPYAGARTWRDLLTSDPAVDLVHFTILREPDKLDSTPSNELSLIAFPFEELFEIKLYDFDLIVFDRYRLNRILPQDYFNNIVRFVEKGGALLVTSGPSYSDDDSIYFTSLMEVLPGSPDGGMIKIPFKPALTEEGKKHPVTRNLHWPSGRNGEPGWGPWLRQVSLNMQSGEALLSGADNKPLLILDRVKEGRVAQIASDHIWLWSRGYQGGGPHAEILRRTVHWLMKEPELDERALDVEVREEDIVVRSGDYRAKDMKIAVTHPDGTKADIILDAMPDGTLQKTIRAEQLGIYGFEDPAGQRQFAVVGEVNPPELQNVKTTPDLFAPLVKASGGGAVWLAETPEPGIKRLAGGRIYAGYNWIGLRQNGDYTVKGVEDKPLLPAWLAALWLVSFAAFTWWREGRS
jgi:hypothetical protein